MAAAPAALTARARKKERTRRDIYAAAMALFAKRGYSLVTIEHICEAAGIAKATFFLHFSSKAALLEEFNHQLCERLEDDLKAKGGTAEAQLRHIVAVFIEAWQSHADVMRHMVREFFDQPELVKASQAANRDVVDLVSGVVGRGQEAGEFRKEIAPVLVASALVSTWGAITAHWSEGEEMDSVAVNEQILDLVLGGLRETA